MNRNAALALLLTATLAACQVPIPAPQEFVSEQPDAPPADGVLDDDADAEAEPEVDSGPNLDATTDTSPDVADTADGQISADVGDDADAAADAEDGSVVELPPACTPGSCDDGSPCTTDSCDPAKGCVASPAAGPCDDGDACTEGDSCIDGTCSPGGAKACDDGEPCTDDGCESASGCVALPNVATCSDGDACTAADACAGGTCKSGPALACDDGNPCTDDACDKVAGCVNLPNAATCTDGNACTVGDVCSDGACKAGNVQDCGDGNPCTGDACDPASGCVTTPLDATPCDADGSVCTEGDACVAGTCAAGPAVNCDDGNPCTEDACEAVTGCVATPLEGKGCDADGSVCTESDACVAGVCTAGPGMNCDDGNPCTEDSCEAAEGCVAAPNTVTCTDEDICTTNDACTGGVCVPGALDTCADGNVCTFDTCIKGQGCLHLPQSVPCSDGDACTANDACVASACSGGAVDCDDGDACTKDSCDTSSGCKHMAVVCKDGDACTLDVCDVGTGNCLFTPAVWNTAFGGGGDQAAAALASVPDGGYVVLGTTGVYTQSYPSLLTRFDSAGKLLWTKEYANGSYGSSAAVVALQGGFAFAGRTMTKGAGKLDAWLVRTDKDGNTVWDKTFGTYLDDSAGGLIALPDGGFLMSMSVGCCNPTDASLVRTDANGIALWQQTYGGASFEDLGAMAALPDGGFAALGYSKSTNLPGGQGSVGGADVWLLRTDAKGSVLWNRTYGGEGNDFGNALLVLPDGGFVLGGQTNSQKLPGGQKSHGGNDGWLIRADAAGNMLWHNVLGGASGDDTVGSLIAAGEGIAFAGTTSSIDLPGGAISKGTDAWLGRVDALGNLSWNRAIGGAGVESGRALLKVAGGFVMLGEATSKDLPGGQTTSGGSDGWLLRLDEFGHATCSEAGACVGEKPANCDDGKPCTLDTCDGQQGCSHSETPTATTCNDGDACTVGETCLAGKCQGGKPKYLEKTIDGHPDRVPTAVRSTLDGGLVVTVPGGPQGTGAVRIIRLAADGSVAFDATADASNPHTYAHDVIGLKDGGFAIPGEHHPWDGGTALTKVDAAGKVIWKSNGGFMWWHRVVELGDGSLIGAGATDHDGCCGGRDWMLGRYSADGKLLWKKPLGTGTHDFAAGLACDAAGTCFASGVWNVSSSSHDGSVVRFQADGTVLWQKQYGLGLSRGVLAGKDGYLVLGIHDQALPQNPSGKNVPAVLKIDASGGVVWKALLSELATHAPRDLAVLDDGRIVVVGSASGSNAGFVAWLGAQGNLLAKVTVLGQEPTELTACSGLPGGELLLAGRKGTKDKAWLGRMDAWGNLTCSEAGACASLGFAACNDGNSCTTDACEAAKGCTHAALPDGAACGDGKSCKVGSCQ